MRTNRIGRLGVSALVASALVAAVGCDLVKVGGRCSSGAASARDSTHLVLCKKGRWTRSITLQETANILVALLPAKAEVVGGSDQTTQVGEAFAKDFKVKVTRGDGQPSVGTEVVLDVPATGPSLDRGPRSVRTGGDGVASFLATANNVAGSYDVVAKVSGRDVSTTFTFTNTAAAAKSVSVVSGGAQSAVADTNFASPVVLKVTDAYGNAVKGATPVLTSPNVMVTGQPSTGTFTTPAATGADGLATFTVKAPATAGLATFTAVTSAANASFGVTFSLTVRPDVPATVDIAVANGTQSAARSAAFALPLSVTVLDQFGNPVPGKTVTYTVAPSGGGAAATLSSATATTDAGGVGSVTATANATAGSYSVFVTVQDFDQQSSIEFDLTNT